MSDGYCEVDFAGASDDCEAVEFADVSLVRARKSHACSECGGAIAKGEKHWRASYKFEGKVQTERRCPPCQETAAEFEFHIYGGLLWTHFAEEWENGARVQSCIARLTTARAKEHMRQRWVQWNDARMERQRKRVLSRKQAAVDPHVPSTSD
jgi:hypothetical protein